MNTAHKGDRLRNARIDQFVDEVITPARVSEPILDAFRQVDRAVFAPAEAENLVYTDRIIDLKEGATISQPSLVAWMLEVLDLKGQEKVLEIGTATGYQAALLSHLAGEIHTIELDEELAQTARDNLTIVGSNEVNVVCGDGALGFPDAAPFDRIIVTAATRRIPPALLNQLAPGGKIVAPIGNDWQACQLVLVEKSLESDLKYANCGGCAFVPLYSTEPGGWTEELLIQKETEKIEKERKEIRGLLTQLWTEKGLVYDEFIPSVIEEYSLELPDGDLLSEGEVLDRIGLALRALYPTNKKGAI